MMKKTKICKVTALFFLLAPGTVMADDWTQGWAFAPRATIGVIDYQFTSPQAFDPETGQEIVPKTTIDLTLFLGGVGITVFKDRFYLDVYAQTTDEDSATGILGENFKGDRDELSVTLGYSLTERLAIYAGYKFGQTEASGSFGTSSDFEEEGFFLGATYGLPLWDKGVLSFNLAIASLDGDLEFSNPAAPLLTIDATSETVGLSYGLSWRSRITDRVGYFIAVDGYQYDFDEIIDRRLGSRLGEFEEDLLTARVGISYEFY